MRYIEGLKETLIALIAIGLATFLVWFGKINGSVWATVIIAASGGLITSRTILKRGNTIRENLDNLQESMK